MLKSIQKNIIVLLCVIILLSLAVSCSRTEPRIAFGFIELVYYQEREKPQERFSFFIIPEDDDGIENLADLYLYHDREQLRWHISSDDWVSHTHDGKVWIGTRSISIGEDQTLPRGQFRAVLVNKGGEKSERNFSFDAPEDPRFPFPTITIHENQFTINSSYPVNRLVCYDEHGNFLITTLVNRFSGTIDELGLPSHARSVALWAEDAQYFTSAYTDVVPIRR